ncbi:MAG: hypothetical protein INH41_11150 [Myxococcaceae bacterium]|jgi:hypothetical protein|nr:hypothetical protein [Myxococcaceae bacterium]
MRFLTYVMVALLVPSLARAQAGFSPPPLVEAPPPEPGQAPPPPLTPESGAAGQARPQYLPYGSQQPREAPGPEVGLMVSESLFGMLTAAGIIVLPYFLFGFSSGGLLSGDPVVGTIIAALLFGSAPLAVAQTQVSIANGSRHYMSETWPAALAGLAAQAAVLGLTYLTGGNAIVRNTVTCPVGAMPAVPTGCGNDAVLLVGSIVVVPLVQMIVINAFKQPRFKPAVASRDAKTGALSLGVPTPTPLLGMTPSGLSVGASVSLVDLRF